jgi:hypothetical protein
MELISGEAASIDAPSLDMDGRELQLLAFVLSTRDVSVVAADRRLTQFSSGRSIGRRSSGSEWPTTVFAEVGRDDVKRARPGRSRREH